MSVLVSIFLLFACSGSVGGGADSAVRAADPAVTTSWDLGGGLVLDEILGLGVAYYESEEDVCEAPASVALGFADSTVDPLLYFKVYFEGVSPGEFDVMGVIEGDVGDADPAKYTHMVTLAAGGVLYPAISGTGEVELDKAAATAVVSLSGLVFRDYSGTFEGKTNLDITGVGCHTLTDEEGGDGDGDCGWVQEPIDTTDPFCTEARDGYAVDALD